MKGEAQQDAPFNCGQRLALELRTVADAVGVIGFDDAACGLGFGLR